MNRIYLSIFLEIISDRLKHFSVEFEKVPSEKLSSMIVDYYQLFFTW